MSAERRSGLDGRRAAPQPHSCLSSPRSPPVRLPSRGLPCRCKVRTGQGGGGPGKEREKDEKKQWVGSVDRCPAHLPTHRATADPHGTRAASSPPPVLRHASRGPTRRPVGAPALCPQLPVSRVPVGTYVGSVPALPARTGLLEHSRAARAEACVPCAPATPLPARSGRRGASGRCPLVCPGVPGEAREGGPSLLKDYETHLLIQQTIAPHLLRARHRSKHTTPM